MNAKRLLTALAATVLLIGRTHANIVGYVNLTFQPGANWFANPLVNPTPYDSLSALFPTAPNGTTVSLWDPTTSQFTTTSTFNNGAWSLNFNLDPGTGALLDTSSQFANTFTGTVENFDGTIVPGDNSFTQPPAFSGPNGIYFFSSKAPITLSGTTFGPNTDAVFQSIIGRAPQQGESVTTLNALTQTYTTTTFLNGAWNNGIPTLAIGQAAMFNLGPVPEPSSLALIALGTIGGYFLKRRRQTR
jgi:PEP-CTERM motif